MKLILTMLATAFFVGTACQSRDRASTSQLTDLIRTDTVPESFVDYGVGVADRGILSWSWIQAGMAPRKQSFEINASEVVKSGKLSCKDNGKTLDVERILASLELQTAGIDASKTSATGRGEVHLFSIFEEDFSKYSVDFYVGRKSSQKQAFYLTFKAYGIVSKDTYCDLMNSIDDKETIRKLVLLTFKRSNDRLRSISEEGRSDIDKRFLSFHEKGFKESISDITWDFLPKQRPHVLRFKNTITLKEQDKLPYSETYTLPGFTSFNLYSLCDGIHVEELRKDGPPTLLPTEEMHYAEPWVPFYTQRPNGQAFDMVHPPELLQPDGKSLAKYRFVFSKSMGDELSKIKSEDSVEQYNRRVDYVWQKFEKCEPLQVVFR